MLRCLQKLTGTQLSSSRGPFVCKMYDFIINTMVLSLLNHCFHPLLYVRCIFNFDVTTQCLFLPSFALTDEYGAVLLIFAVLLVFVHVTCYNLPVFRVLIMKLSVGQ